MFQKAEKKSNKMETKKMLELRTAMRKKRPRFIRQNKLQKGLKRKWRKPKGIHSKMRSGIRGKAAIVQAGYSSPKQVRGFHKSGLKPVIINTMKELEKINAKTEGAVIASKTGLKKKIEIVKKASEKGIKLLNVKNLDKFAKKIEQKRAEKKKRLEEKKKKPAKAAPKKKLEEKLTDEEKKKAEKKEKDKLLTKREGK